MAILISKLFRDVVDLYKSDHETLERILQEDCCKMNNSIWQKFLLWLGEVAPSEEKEIVALLSMVSALAIKNKQIQKPISEISDAAEIERLQSIMKNPNTLGLHSKKRSSIANRALNSYVRFLREKDEETSTLKKPQAALIEKHKSQYAKPIVKLLSKRYKYGFRLGSPIELNRLRNYAEEDSIPLPESDELLEREIVSAGMNIDGRIFVISEDLLSGVASLVDTVFNEGATVIFLDRLIEVKEEWLTEQHITTADMLKELLKRVRPQYCYRQNIITPSRPMTEHDATVKEILRVSEGQSIVYTNKLRELLPYIPAEKIAWSLSMSSEFVWVSEGKYFLMNKFFISEENANAIAEYVDRECSLNGYASITSLPLGSIPEENYELSEAAIQAAIYSSVLKENYYLRGKILTRDENGVDINALLKTYCSGKRRCTVSELMTRAEELTGALNKQNAMTVLYDTMVRVGLDEFVSEEQIHFDISAVDALLKNMIGDRFAPIRGVNTFALFPTCGASWNHYVLESFCYRFSNEYCLFVMNYNDKNAGLIVQRNLTMSYADMLCEAAAQADISLTQEAVGQYFFDNGYTAKRKYSMMPEILERAKKIREEG